MGFPTKNDHFGVFWGYHHLRKHPYVHHLWHFHRREGQALPTTAELPHWACECEQTSRFVPDSSAQQKSGWWLNQPIWKICLSKWDHFPRVRDENKKVFETTGNFFGTAKFVPLSLFFVKNDASDAGLSPLQLFLLFASSSSFQDHIHSLLVKSTPKTGRYPWVADRYPWVAGSW